MVDVLNNYDMVWALTQGTINAQLRWLFTKLTPPGQQGIQHVTFGELFDADGEVKDSVHVDAYLGVPSIEIPEGNDSTVYLYIPFASGTFQHLALGGAGVYTVDLKPDPNNLEATTWMLCFKVDLNVADITHDLDCSSNKPPANMHRETYDKLCGFQSSNFTIRQIFLDLQNVDQVTYLESQSKIPAHVTASVTRNGKTTPNQPDRIAANELRAAFEDYYFPNLKADANTSPYILGYTANAGFDNVSAFQPTGTVYSTHYYEPPAKQQAVPDLSTFEFLLVTYHKTPPLTNLGFAYNLVNQTGISGTGRVANATVVSDWLANSALSGGSIVETIAKAVGVPMANLVYDPAKHEWSGRYQYTRDHDNYLVVDSDVKVTNAITIAFSHNETDAAGKTGPGLAISGSFAVRFDFDFSIGPLDICSGHYIRTQPFTMSIVMSPGTGADGNAAITLSRSGVRQGKDHDEESLSDACDIPGLSDAAGKIMEAVLEGPFTDLENLKIDDFAAGVDSALKTLSSQIILPAPSVFAYKDVSFNDEFDLVTDFNYITKDQ